jgi:hypothetical protein
VPTNALLTVKPPISYLRSPSLVTGTVAQDPALQAEVNRTISTSRLASRNAPDRTTDTGVRLVSRIVREVAAGRTFEDAKGLELAVRSRLARLGIRSTPAQVSDAIGLVESNTRIVRSTGAAKAGPYAPSTQHPAPAAPLNRAEASRALALIADRLRQDGRTLTVRSL